MAAIPTGSQPPDKGFLSASDGASHIEHTWVPNLNWGHAAVNKCYRGSNSKRAHASRMPLKILTVRELRKRQ